MPYAELDGLDLYYADRGDVSAPPVLLLHGFTRSGDAIWGPHVEAFTGAYRVIVPDLRGHGRTGNPDGADAINLHQFATDIGSLCKFLAIESAAFCGYSAGAILQLWLALDEPGLLAASVQISSTLCIRDSIRAIMRSKSADQLAGEWFGPASDDPSDRYPPTWAHHVALGPDHPYQVLSDFLALFGHPHDVDFPEAAALATIDVPTLVVQGDHDEFFPVEDAAELCRRLPHAELQVLEETPHHVLEARPEVIESLCLPFLARTYPGSDRIPSQP